MPSKPPCDLPTRKRFSLGSVRQLCRCAFLVNISQFLVTQHVGALSMQVLGNVKTIVTVVFSVVIFKNVVGLRSVLGYALTLIGCFVYLREKRKREAIEHL